MNYEYRNVVVERVVDGDTVYFKLKKEYQIDFGFKIYDTLVKETIQDFRLARINTPEKRGETKAAAIEAENYLKILLNKGPIRLVSIKSDKYGRYLAELFVDDNGTEFNINDAMLAAGHAVPYKD